MQQEITKLEKARAYEKERYEITDKTKRPLFHVTAPIGWINDPNGFSRYQDSYHLFCQYHPYSTVWGPMHWSHNVTKDFIKWEKLPCAMAPDTEYDGQGCFSGSAVESDGKHILMYTSVVDKLEEDGSHYIRQTQSIAIGDGLNYEKIEENPVLKAEVLPEGSSLEDFRDPRIWKEGDTFYAVVGSRASDGSGQIAYFSSKDVKEWKFEGIIDASKNEYGKMWECPDFFTLEGKDVLIVSPQNMTAKGYEIHNGNNVLYFTGKLDKENKIYHRGEGRQVDFGLDFYAPQTVETTDGRRVMIGWLQSWDNYMAPADMDWAGMMTIPRELHFEGDKLVQFPVREFAEYHQNEVVYQNVAIKDQAMTLANISGRVVDLFVDVEAGDYEKFIIDVASDEKGHKTSLIYDRRDGLFTVDRNYSGIDRDILTNRSMLLDTNSEKISLRIVMDKYSLEVFVNGGRQAMSNLIYTGLSAQDITFSAVGTAEFSVKKYDIVLE